MQSPQSTAPTEPPKGDRTRIQLTRVHRILIGVVIAGAVVIAGIGFAGSYAAVRELALKKGFGNFSYAFPIGIDAGICVLLALDLLLTWIRIPFPLLRQAAWLLTAATIAFNGAAAWPDPLGVGMHAVIPILFVVAVEAARHAIGRIADITADKHMEGVRITRWLLSPGPTFLLWRRMKLWELRSYEQVIKLEQQRLVYQARLRSRYGRNWRRKAPVESLMPLRLAKYGVPLADTAPAGLAAAGITMSAEELAVVRGYEPKGTTPALEASASTDGYVRTPTPELDAAEAPPGPSDADVDTDTDVDDVDSLLRARGYSVQDGAAPDDPDDVDTDSTYDEEPLLSEDVLLQPHRAPVPDYSRAPRPLAAQARIPGQLDHVEDEVDGQELDEEPLDGDDGRLAVRQAYDELPAAERALSARQLGERLAPQLGLSVNTVRLYIGEIRREARGVSTTTGAIIPPRSTHFPELH